MMRTVKSANKIIKQSAKVVKIARTQNDEKSKSSQAFIAAAKNKSESYQRIQKMRKSIESK